MLTHPRIVGGQPAIACQWPTIVDMSTCTGVLIHPRIVVFAGHCGPQGEARFGNSFDGFTVSIDPADCEVNPLWTSPGYDVAYCRLPVDVTGIPLVHMLGEPEPLPVAGDPITLVGYGRTEDGPTNGTKYFGVAPYVGFDEGELRVGGNGVDTCSGDSGGPAMVEMSDGTWRILGITSRAEDGADLCGGISRYTFAPTATAWVEEMSGIDVSPCFDLTVPIGCDPSDSEANDPAPAWCNWSGEDETGDMATGDVTEDSGSLDSTGEAIESDGTAAEAIPDDGCGCSMGNGFDPALLVVLVAYRAARTASSYASW